MVEKVCVLVGNPNTGKTTIFNNLANANEHIGNWHGVTVDYKEKKLSNKGHNFVLTDLPGIYSLSSYSFEEAVSRDYLLRNKDCVVVNVCDANNLQRNLFLTLQLLEMRTNLIMCINMSNELKKYNKKIDINKLQKILDIPIFLINGQDKKDINILSKNLFVNDNKSYNILPYEKMLLQSEFLKNLDDKIPEEFDKRFFKIKLLEQDEFFINLLKISEQEKSVFLKKLIEQNTLEHVASERYRFIEKIIDDCIICTNPKTYGYSNIDKIILNKWLCIPIFLLIILAIFYVTFSGVGGVLSESLTYALQTYVFMPISEIIKKSTSNLFVINFFLEALFGSVLSLLSFLPQIVFLFLGLFVLEDCGYMSRLAFCTEDIFKKIGLSGKSVFSLLMGFGCSTTAALTSRTLEDKNSKIKTAMLTPYISCSAKLPLYLVICGAFFVKQKFLIIFGLYLLGVVVAISMSAILEKTILKSGEQSFLMEFAPYRFPSIKKILKNILQTIKDFLVRVGSVVLLFSCIVWLLANCNFKMQYNVGKSILQIVSEIICPIFAPLGFGTWGATTCILCGIVAKEIIVSTIAQVNLLGTNASINQISNSVLLSTSAFCLTRSSGLSFLVFALLYAPCVATMGVFVKEIGLKHTLFAVVMQFGIAYLISFVVYRIALFFECYGLTSTILSALVVIVITFSLLLLKRYFKKQKCVSCVNSHICKNNKCR